MENTYIYTVIQSPTGETLVKRTDADGNEAWIPADPANSDYHAYLVSIGEAPEPEIVEETPAPAPVAIVIEQ